MKKHIVIAGPIGDFGGRDVEVNIIAKALEKEYQVSIVSTAYMTGSSFALAGLQNTTWKSVPKELYRRSAVLRGLSKFSKRFNKGPKEAYAYLINRFSKKLTDLDRLQWHVLQNELQNADMVLLCVQLTTKFLPETVQYCHEHKIPCLVRTTGTIRNVTETDFDLLKKVRLFIHHSEANAQNLNRQLALPYTVIDQCALAEDQLLALPLSGRKPFRFGYLGRLSAEKGILPIARFFAQTDCPFVVAGDGPQKAELQTIIRDSSNCTYMGLLQNHELHAFFSQIDVLVIPSYEESGPLVGLEAMAAGKIIISTKVGAMEERLAPLEGHWFAIENLATFESSINKVNALSLDDYQAAAALLRKRYKDEYSFEAVALKYQKLIHSILQ
ncbi:glycosyltransferase family 4 protein [Flavobacterium suncheonense]|uniref:Glycosyl transferase family 1 domain-containing protein n=1 Tax=Flavobacterium suncheonense GH29-5 = DSM 17707 TaxID=1121899 RepID=A0A0A2M9Q8_9FLAO|nr:glycosyltransferase family 4 protein [Flavobacterium suncheonense]KGO89412.1 hypothetical protein Q764_08540 [Flavobacterium suncheonense GH29-5 = DSM 17707]